jgi:putative transposase
VTTKPLSELLDRLAITPAGRKLINEAQAHSPVSAKMRKSYAVDITYHSHKMGGLVEVTSNRLDFPRTTLLEHDDDVLAYFPRPIALDICIDHPKIERTIRFQYIPNFMVVRKHRIVIEEWREDDQLVKLAARQPNRYVQAGDGGWTSPPLIAHCDALGIQYEVHASSELPRRYVENIMFLRDYHDSMCPPLDPAARQTLQEFMAEDPVRHLHDLIHVHGVRSDDIFKALADGLVVADLDDERLADSRRVRIFRDLQTLNIHRLASLNVVPLYEPASRLILTPGTQITYEGDLWCVALVGARKIVMEQGERSVEMTLSSLEKLHQSGAISVVTGTQNQNSIDNSQGQSVSALANLSKAEIEQTLKRVNALAETNKRHQQNIASERTLRRWRALRRIAIAAGGNEALALAPKISQRGNRLSKLPEPVLKICLKVIESVLLTNEAPNCTACFHNVVVACDEEKLKPPSLRSFTRLVNRISEVEKARKREGPRSAYQKQAFYWLLEYDTPAHGVRPWENIHIDHTQLDIELISSITGQSLGRPWATFASDGNSRRIVGIYLTFDPPSYRSVLMVVRDMVRRFGRVGANLILDRGVEFRGNYMQLILKLLGCDRKLRPSASPRAGSTCERLFGTANTTFIHNLVGNTKITKHVRTATKSVMPKNLAEWTLECFYFALEYWAFTLYDQKKHPALGMAPAQAYAISLTNTGVREHRLWRFDRDFLILTCPYPPHKGDMRTIELQRGIRVNEDYYWSSTFSNPLLVGKKVEVRYDPWDPRYAFARINNTWQICRSKRYGLLDDYSEIELRSALEELKQLAVGTRLKDMAPETMREWLKIREPSNFESVLRERQASSRLLYSALGMYSVSQFDQLSGATEPLQGIETASTCPESETKNSDVKTTDADDYNLESTPIAEENLYETF